MLVTVVEHECREPAANPACVFARALERGVATAPANLYSHLAIMTAPRSPHQTRKLVVPKFKRS